MNYWLFKTEPQTYSIDDLKREKNQTTYWDGVRNYQARNRLRDEIAEGDRVLLYHSSCPRPGVVGSAVVVKSGYPDFTALDSEHPHYDPQSRKDQPRWFMVDIRLDQKFAALIPLDELKLCPGLAKMELLQKGSRLSIQRVSPQQFAAILKMAS